MTLKITISIIAMLVRMVKMVTMMTKNGDDDDKCESKTLTCRVSSRSPTVGGKRTLVSFLLLKIIIIIIMIVGGKSTLVLMGNLSFSAKIIF